MATLASSVTLTPSAAARVAAIAARQGKPALLRLAVDLVRGCAVDYVESLGGAAFKVDNPNAASGCGCGSSFSV